MTKFVVDDCPDANGNYTIRFDDGSVHGDTNRNPIATVYSKEFADMLAASPELLEIVRDLSLCLDEDYHHQGTHYIRETEGVQSIEPKGSFIELVARARKVTEKLDG